MNAPWSLEGHRVSGTLHGVPYIGFVISSEPDAAYGSVRHVIALDEAIIIQGSPYKIIHLDSSTSDTDWESLRVIG